MSRTGNSHSRSKPSIPTDENLKVTIDLNKQQSNNLYNESELSQLRQQNSQLKKQLKEAQMKRNLAIKQLSQALHRNESLEKRVGGLQRRSKDKADRSSAEEYKVQQLHFLNRELNNEIESLRSENEKLIGQLRHSTSLLESKYHQLERNTLSKVQLAAKRIRKTVGYLSSLSGKELEKTRNSLVDNLQKSLELLRGRFVSDDLDDQVDEIMSPLNVLKEELTGKDRDMRQLKERLEHLEEQLSKQQNINRDIIPQYKSAVEKLKKSLQQCRTRIAELEQEKQTVKQSHEAKLKELQKANKDLSSNLTRVTIQNKVYQGRLEQLQGQVEEEKDRLQDENQLLKKLYSNHESVPSSPSNHSHYRPAAADPSALSSSRSSAQLSHSRSLAAREMALDRPPTVSSKHSNFVKKLHPHQETSYSLDRDRQRHSLTHREPSSYDYDINQPDLSRATLKNEIDQVDQQIAEIQKNLARQLQAYTH